MDIFTLLLSLLLPCTLRVGLILTVPLFDVLQEDYWRREAW
jgi:hypothetical protein